MQQNFLTSYGIRRRKEIDVSLEWSILDKAKLYSSSSRNCIFCLIKKYHILFLELNLLNKRSEPVSKCRHENKYHLLNCNHIQT